MNAEHRPTYESKPESTVSNGGGLTVNEDDELLCARTNMRRMLAGDPRSKELVALCLETTGSASASFMCPAGVCDVSYTLDLNDGSMSRGVEGCAVITVGLLKASRERNRGMTLSEFAQTPLGKKTVK